MPNPSAFDKPPVGQFVDEPYVRSLMESLEGHNSPPMRMAQTLEVVGALTATGGMIATTITASGNVTVQGDLQANGGVSLGNAPGDVITVVGTATFTAPATFNAAVTLGDAAADAVTMNGTVTANAPVTVKELFTVQNSAGTAFPLVADPTNTRVLIGTNTAPGSVANDRLDVVGGRLFVLPNNEELAIGLRYGSGAVGTMYLGATNSATPSLVVKDNSGNTVVTVGNAASLYQLTAHGDFNVTDDAVIAGDLSADRLVAGATTFVGAEKLRVAGTTRLEGNVTQTTGVLSAPGLSITTNGASIVGGLNLDAGGGLLLLATNVFTVGSVPRTLAGHALTSINGSSVYLAYYS